MYKKLQMLVLFVFGIGLPVLYAQEAVPASGGEATSSTGSVSYSIGQTDYITSSGENVSIAEGVQQPYEIFVVTSIGDVSNIDLDVVAYPNPATNYLQLQIKGDFLKDLSFQLYDMNGKLFQKQEITSSETKIIMSDLSPATYFVNIMRGNKGIKTFKIIKN